MVELKGKQLLVSTIIGLLMIGALSYGSLPDAYCPLEDKTVKYVHMSESRKTVTKVIPSGSNDGEFQILDDRCQKGMNIGEWIPLNKESVNIQEVCDKPLVIAYTDNGKYFCDGIGIDVECVKDGTLEMPFG